MLYVGLDVHKSYVYAVAVSEAVQKRSSGRLSNHRITLQKYVDSLPDQAKIVMEAGYGWPFVYDALEGHAESIVLSHPKKTKVVASARIKTDKVDATVLAQLLRMDFLPTAYIPERKVRDLRDLLRHRAYLVRTRTGVKNRLHAILSRYGIRHGFSDLFGKAGRAFLEELELRPIQQLTLVDNLFLIDALNQRIKRVTKRIDALAQQLDRAESGYRQALEVFQRLRHPPDMVDTLAQLGVLRRKQGRPQEVLSWFGQAWAIADQYQMRVGMQILARLALLMRAMGEEAFGAAWRAAFEGQEPPLEALRDLLRRLDQGEQPPDDEEVPQ